VTNVTINPHEVRYFNVCPANIDPDRKTKLTDREVLLNLNLPSFDCAIGKFRGNTCTIAYGNNTEEAINLRSDEILGLAHLVGDGVLAQRTPADRVVAGLTNQTQIPYTFSTSCFCKMKHTKPTLKVFFLKTDLDTGLRGVDIRNNAGYERRAKCSKITTQNNGEHLLVGPDLDGITDKHLSTLRGLYGAEGPLLIVCLEREEDMTFVELDFLGRLSKHFGTVEARIFNHGGQGHLCHLHAPLPMSECDKVDIILLTGGLTDRLRGQQMLWTTHAGLPLEVYYQKTDDRYTYCMHFPQTALDNECLFRTVVEGLIY
jgi:hypothetical protein